MCIPARWSCAIRSGLGLLETSIVRDWPAQPSTARSNRTHRKSRSATCTQLILKTEVLRVVIAWIEPPLFVANAAGPEILPPSSMSSPATTSHSARRCR